MEVRQNIVVFTGAGISKESGIPTFRDMDGMWKKYDAMKLASAAGFEEDPEEVPSGAGRTGEAARRDHHHPERG